MVKTQNSVPEVYYNRSRDFQLLGRIYDIVFNYLKYNTDTIYNAPSAENVDDSLINLLTSTLGFKQSHEYNIKQLKALCSIFTLALRNKGNITSINYILNLLGNVENISDPFLAIIPESDPYLLQIFTPQAVTDTTLLEDMLNYILPAGMSYQIIKQMLVMPDNRFTDNYVMDTVKARVTNKHEFQTSQILQPKEISGSQNLILPKESDIETGRIDNEIVVGYPKDGLIDIQTYIKEDQTESTPTRSDEYPKDEPQL